MKDEVLNRIRDSIEDLLNDRRSLVKVLTVVMILLLAAILRIHGANKADIKIENVGAAETTQSEDADETDESASSGSQVIFVDLGGAVNKPGVYQVAEGTRLFQVIEMAGGLTEEADANSVNQASFVEDGSKVIIPSKGNVQTSDGTQDNAAAASDVTSGAASGVTPADALININIASKEELTTLNGIGDAIAERIIEYRASNRFKKKEDIMSVKGIGSATYDKIKDRITV